VKTLGEEAQESAGLGLKPQNYSVSVRPFEGALPNYITLYASYRPAAGPISTFYGGGNDPLA